MEAVILAWVVTYLLHSTILMAGAWLLERRWSDRPERMSGVWKTALVGGVLTASVQIGLGVSPWAGHMVLQSTELTAGADALTAPAVEFPLDPAVVEAEPRLTNSAVRSWPPTDVSVLSLAEGSSMRDEPRESSVTMAGTTSTDVVQGTPSVSWWIAFGPWIVGLLGIGAVLGLVSVLVAFAALRRELRGRHALPAGPMRTLFDRLRERAGVGRRVPLMIASRVRVPMAVGVVSPEIIIPPQVPTELSVEHQQSLLAHELAHVLRRDPAWRLVSLFMERVLFFQPLNRLASRKISQSAEYLCDDWAARHTRKPLALASCLTEIATWVAHPGPIAATMAGPRSILGRRVHRLLRPAVDQKPPRWLAIGLALPLLGIVLAAPGVSAGAQASEEAEGPSVVVVDGGSDRNEWVAREGTVVIVGESEGDEVNAFVAESSPSHAVVQSKAERRRGARADKRAADKARRRARKDLRRAFRGAKRRGDAVPSEREVQAILGRSRPSETADPNVFELHVVVPGQLEVHGRLPAEFEVLEGLQGLEELAPALKLLEQLHDSEVLEGVEELAPALELLEHLQGREGGDFDIVLRSVDPEIELKVQLRHERAQAQHRMERTQREQVRRVERRVREFERAHRRHERHAPMAPPSPPQAPSFFERAPAPPAPPRAPSFERAPTPPTMDDAPVVWISWPPPTHLK